MKTASLNEVLKHSMIEKYICIPGQKYFKKSTSSSLFHIMLFYFLSRLYAFMQEYKNMPLQGTEMTVN